MEKGQSFHQIEKANKFPSQFELLKTTLQLEKEHTLSEESFKPHQTFGLNNGHPERQNVQFLRLVLAKKILNDLNLAYERLFSDEDDRLWLNVSDRQAYFKSHLLYFIAVTEDNEDTFGHSQFVASYTLLLSKALGFENVPFLMDIERGALLHDIGKIGIPEWILKKSGPLTFLEREIIKEHPLLGYEIIREFNFLHKADQVVLYHHEHYDGSGYPFQLAGQNIPLEARIFSLADTVDAITSDRPYRKGRSFEEAFREIERCRGSQFDPFLVDALLEIPQEQWCEAKENTQNTFKLPTIHWLN